MWRVMHRYQREVDRVLLPLDLTHLQFTMLAMAAWLCRSGEPVSQAELSRQADIHPMQVSLMLKALEAKGMVGRARSPSDTRAKRIAITAAGLEALRGAMPCVIEVQRRIFGNEGALGGTLLTMLQNLDARSD
jgi:DNA-binding MarR family transcriptional regulator